MTRLFGPLPSYTALVQASSQLMKKKTTSDPMAIRPIQPYGESKTVGLSKELKNLSIYLSIQFRSPSSSLSFENENEKEMKFVCTRESIFMGSFLVYVKLIFLETIDPRLILQIT
jgi:hypothetical protein